MQRTCIGYIRVSTAMQIDGISLRAQEHAIEAYAQQRGWSVRLVERDEGLSGTSMKKRAALRRVMDSIREGEVLIVHSLSRLARSLSDTLELVAQLKRRKADLASASEPIDTVSVTGQLMLNLLATFAQFEAQVIAERVRACMAEKRRRKEHVGQPPIGYRLRDGPGSGLVEDEEEQRLIAFVHAQREGIEPNGRPPSFATIAGRLEEAGFRPPRRTKRWHPMLVYRLYHRRVENTRGRHEREA